MAQIMALDYGKKRTGLAATDDMCLVASGLDTVETPKLLAFLKAYFSLNQVSELVVGYPLDLKAEESEIEKDIKIFIQLFQQEFPSVGVVRMDERFTSKLASYYISQSGHNKKKRQDKSLIDRLSATILLQNYLDQIKK